MSRASTSLQPSDDEDVDGRDKPGHDGRSRTFPNPMTPRTATLIGLTAILMWSLLSVLTVATGKIPAFQLAAMTFAIGALVAFASFLFRPSAFGALKQPPIAWVVGVGEIGRASCRERV